MVWEIFHWHRIFKIDFACHLMLKKNWFPKSAVFNLSVISLWTLQWFNLSCDKVVRRFVLCLLRAEDERSLTAFVAGTTRSIKLQKGKNVWQIINSISFRSIFFSIAYVQTPLPWGEGGSVHRLLEQISTKILCKNICLAASLSMKHSLLSLRFVPRFPKLTSEIRCITEIL